MNSTTSGAPCGFSESDTRPNEFQVEGTATIQEFSDPPLASRAIPFSVAVANEKWLIKTTWDTNVTSSVGFDGTNTYGLNDQKQPGPTSAGIIWEGEQLYPEVELVRLLWFAYASSSFLGRATNLVFAPPFGMDQSLLLEVFSAELVREASPPHLPLRATFKVSQDRLQAVLQEQLSKNPALARKLTNAVSVGDLGARYSVISSKEYDGLVIPTKVQLEQYQPRSNERLLTITTLEVTNVVPTITEPLIPQPHRSTWVHDLRAGRILRYQATNGLWLSHDEVAKVGKELFRESPNLRIL